MEQIHNEGSQNNTVRNLLIVLLVAVIGGGGFMIYSKFYNTPHTAQQNNENPNDTSSNSKLFFEGTKDWLSKQYQSFTPKARQVINGIGVLVAARILYPIFRRKKKTSGTTKSFSDRPKR